MATATVLTLAVSPAVNGQSQVPAPDPQARQDRLTGSWGERRTLLEGRGVALGGTVTLDLARLRGGDGAGGLVGRAPLDANTTIDLERLLGFPGTTPFVQY